MASSAETWGLLIESVICWFSSRYELIGDTLADLM